MEHRFLIHGSVHGVTPPVSEYLKRFKDTGGRINILKNATLSGCKNNESEKIERNREKQDVIVTYDGHCSQNDMETLLQILEGIETASEEVHGVITFGWSHQEPSHMHIGRKHYAHPLWNALINLHVNNWFSAVLNKKATL